MAVNRKRLLGRARPRKVAAPPAPRVEPAIVEDLVLLRELEDRIDLKDARQALAEAKGKLIPWETVKRQLGL